MTTQNPASGNATGLPNSQITTYTLVLEAVKIRDLLWAIEGLCDGIAVQNSYDRKNFSAALSIVKVAQGLAGTLADSIEALPDVGEA